MIYQCSVCGIESTEHSTCACAGSSIGGPSPGAPWAPWGTCGICKFQLPPPSAAAHQCASGPCYECGQSTSGRCARHQMTIQYYGLVTGTGIPCQSCNALRAENAKLRWMLAKWEKFETAGVTDMPCPQCGEYSATMVRLESATLRAENEGLKARLGAAEKCIEWLRAYEEVDDDASAALKAYDQARLM